MILAIHKQNRIFNINLLSLLVRGFYMTFYMTKTRAVMCVTKQAPSKLKSILSRQSDLYKHILH